MARRDMARRWSPVRQLPEVKRKTSARIELYRFLTLARDHTPAAAAPGEPCPVCNRVEGDEVPEMPEGFPVDLDIEGWRH